MRKVTFYTPSAKGNSINTGTLVPLKDVMVIEKTKGSWFSLQGRQEIENFGLFLGNESDDDYIPEIVKDEENVYVLIFNKKK